MSASRVGAVVLTWNDTEMAGRCIESVLANDYPNTQIILVDNGSIEPCGEQLGARFPVVTLGGQGCIGGVGEAAIEVPGFAVKARDTTGAGDVFHAAFVAGLLEGLDAPRTLRMANAAAAMNCRALGAQGGLPTRSELAEFLAGRAGGEE